MTTARVRVDWSNTNRYDHPYSDVSDYVASLTWKVGSLGDVPVASLGGLDIENYRQEWVAGQGRLTDEQFLSVHKVEISVEDVVLVRCYGRFARRSLGGDAKVMRMELFNDSKTSLQNDALVNRVTATPDTTTTETFRDEFGLETPCEPSRALLVPGALWYQGSERLFLAKLAQLWGGLWCDNGSGLFSFFRWTSFFAGLNDDDSLTVRALVSRDRMTIRDEPVWVPTDSYLVNSQTLEGSLVLRPDPPVETVTDAEGNETYQIMEIDGKRGRVLQSGGVSFVTDDIANARANPSTGGVVVSLERRPSYRERAFVTTGDELGIVAGSPVRLQGDDPFEVLNADGADAVAAGDVSVSATIANFQVAERYRPYVRSRYILPRKAGTYTYAWYGSVVRAVDVPFNQEIGTDSGDRITDSISIWGLRERQLPPWVTNRAGVIKRMREDLQVLSKPFELAIVNVEVDEASISELAGVSVGSLIGVDITGFPYAALVVMSELIIVGTKVPVLRLHCVRPVARYVAAKFLPPSSIVPEPAELPELPDLETPEEPTEDPNDDDDSPVPEDRRRRDIPLDGLGRPFKHGRSTVLCPTPGTVNRPVPQRKFFDVTCHQMFFGDDDGTAALLPVEADSGSLPWRPHSGSTLPDRIYAEQPGVFVRAKREWPGDASNDIYVEPDGTVRFSSDAAASPWLGQAAISMSRWMRVGNEGDWSKDAWGRVPGTNGLPFTMEHWRTSRWGQGEGGEEFIAQPHLNIIPTRAFTGLRQGTGGSFDRQFQNNRSVFAVSDDLLQGLTMLLMHDGGREYLRVGGATATGTRSEWTSDIATHRSSGGDAGERPYKSSRILDFAFVPTYPAPFDIQVFGNSLTGPTASLTVRFNDTDTLGDYGNFRAFPMSGQYYDGSRWVDGATGDKRLVLGRQKIAEKVAFDVVGWRLSGGCNDDPISSTGDVQLMDMEEEVLLNRITLDLTEDESGRTIFERAAFLPSPVFQLTGWQISRSAGITSSVVGSLTKPSNWRATGPIKAVLNAISKFKFSINPNNLSGALFTARGAVGTGVFATASAGLVAVAAQVVIGGLVTNWMINEIGNGLREQSVQWEGRSARLEFDFPRPGTWVVGMRVTDPDNLSEDAKAQIDPTEFCTKYKGNTIAQTAAYIVWPSAFR